MSCTIQDSLNKRSVVVLKNAALFCHLIMVILNFVSILGCHILKSVSYTAVLSAIFDVVNTEDLLYTVFTFLCVFFAISCSNCLASQHILIVTVSCKTKKNIVILSPRKQNNWEKNKLFWHEKLYDPLCTVSSQCGFWRCQQLINILGSHCVLCVVCESAAQLHFLVKSLHGL